jgi:hypothetical protein
MCNSRRYLQARDADWPADTRRCSAGGDLKPKMGSASGAIIPEEGSLRDAEKTMGEPERLGAWDLRFLTFSGLAAIILEDEPPLRHGLISSLGSSTRRTFSMSRDEG